MENIALSIDTINKTTEGVDLSELKVFTEQEAKSLFTRLCDEEYKQIKNLVLPPVTDRTTYPFAEINEFLKNNTSLLGLGLQNCNIGNAGFEEIFEGLHTNKTLEYLNLDNNALGFIAPKDRPIKDIELGNKLAKIVENNPKLKELTLTRNDLRNAATVPLLKTLINNETLKILDLEDNFLKCLASENTSCKDDTNCEDENYIINVIIKLLASNKTLLTLQLGANLLEESSKIPVINELLKINQIEAFTIHNIVSAADNNAVADIRKTLEEKMQNSSASGPTVKDLITNKASVGNVGFTKSTPSLFHWIKSHPLYTIFVTVLTLAVLLAICIPLVGQIVPALGATVGLASAWVANTLSTALSFLAHTTISVSLIAAKACLATVAGAFTFAIGIAAGKLTSSIKSLVQNKFSPINTLNIQTENVHEDYLVKPDSTHKKGSNLKQDFVHFISVLRSIAGWFFESSNNLGKSETTTFGMLTKKHFLDTYKSKSNESDKSNLTRGNSFFKASPPDNNPEAINKVELSANFSFPNIRMH